MLSNYPFASFYVLLFILFVAIFYRPILRLFLLIPKTDRFIKWLLNVFAPIEKDNPKNDKRDNT